MERELPFPPDKRFLTMGEVSRLSQVPAHTLRYWESRLGLLRPTRRSSGHRLYTRMDVETICLIRDLVYKRKLTLTGARKALLEKKRTGEIKSFENAWPISSAAKSNSTSKILQDIRQEIQSLVAELSQ